MNIHKLKKQEKNNKKLAEKNTVFFHPKKKKKCTLEYGQSMARKSHTQYSEYGTPRVWTHTNTLRNPGGIEGKCHEEARKLSCYLLSSFSVNSEFLFSF